MPGMTDAERDAFLAQTRIGILTTLRDDGSPVAVPVWFEWDGRAVRVFSYRGSGKIKRLQHDPRASLLVTNNVGEPEAWVALAERLANRYWDVNDPERSATIEQWRRIAPSLRLLELVPAQVRTSKG